MPPVSLIGKSSQECSTISTLNWLVTLLIMMTGCLGRCFLALWFSSFLFAAAAPDYKSYRDTPTTPAKEQIAAFAKQHAREQSGAIAYFALGMTAYGQKNYTDAQ